jgi:hypothetical protein
MLDPAAPQPQTVREDAMSGSPKTRTRWIRRPHRHHWLADTRDQDFSAGRLMRGYRTS